MTIGPTYGLGLMRQAGWYWEEKSGSYGRKVVLVGDCLHCGHPIQAEASRAVSAFGSGFVKPNGKAMRPGSQIQPPRITPSPWTVHDLPRKRTCACGKHGGSGCGATYINVDQLIPVL